MSFKSTLQKLFDSNYRKLVKYLENNRDIDLTKFSGVSWEKIKKYIRKDIRSIKVNSSLVKNDLDFFKTFTNLEKLDLGENASLDEKTLEFFCTLGIKELVIGDLLINYENISYDFLTVASNQGVYVYYNGVLVRTVHSNTSIKSNELIIEGKLDEEVVSKLLSNIDISKIEEVQINRTFKYVNSYKIEMQGKVIDNLEVKSVQVEELWRVYTNLLSKGYEFKNINILQIPTSLNDFFNLFYLCSGERIKNTIVNIECLGKNISVMATLIEGKLTLKVKLDDISKVKELNSYIEKYQIPIGDFTIDISDYANKYDEDSDMDFLKRLSKKCNLKINYCGIDSFKSSYDEWVGLRESIKWYRKLLTSYDLSPVEKVLYAHDLIKTIPYKDFGESGALGRAPHLIMNTDYVVCVGYSFTFMEIMRGMDSSIGVTVNHFLKAQHASVMVRIDDEKYDIHGLFELDMTIENNTASRIIGNNNFDFKSSLDLYQAFLIPAGLYLKASKDIEVPNYLNTYICLNNTRLNETLSEEHVEILKNHYKDLFGEPYSGKKMYTYLNAKRPTLSDFKSMLLAVREAQGYSHEEAIKEAERIVKLNLDYLNYKFEVPNIPDNLDLFFKDDVKRSV